MYRVTFLAIHFHFIRFQFLFKFEYLIIFQADFNIIVLVNPVMKCNFRLNYLNDYGYSIDPKNYHLIIV
jgi:hypothetical protein